MIFAIIKFALYVASYGAKALAAWYLGMFFTEVRPLPWRFKPFNCRGCLTFWITLLLCAPYEGATLRGGLMAVGAAFAVFFLIKYKYKVYE